MYQYGRLGKIFYFGFGTNDASGNHSAAAPSQCFVRRVGASADATPIKTSVSAVHLVGTGMPTGCFEVQITAAGADGFSAGERYLVFAHASASGLSTVACIGGFELSAQIADVQTLDGTSVSAAVSALVYVAVLSAHAARQTPTSATTSVIVAGALADFGPTLSANVYVAVLSAHTARQTPTSATTSVIVAGALADYDVPTSADVSVIVAAGPSGSGVSSAQVSVIVAGAFADYDIPTSADVSVIVAANAGAGISSAQTSVIIAGALANYDVPTSADVSAIVEAVSMTSASVSALIGGALTNYTPALSAAVYIAVLSAHTARQTPTSASQSVVVAGALANYDVPTSADLSVAISTLTYQAVLSAHAARQTPTSATQSVVIAGALANYDVPTSADVSVIAANQWRIFTIPEPGAVPDFSSCTPMSALAWLVMLSKNRMTQTSAIAIVQTSAAAEFASASVSDDGTTFTRGPWVS